MRESAKEKVHEAQEFRFVLDTKIVPRLLKDYKLMNRSFTQIS